MPSDTLTELSSQRLFLRGARKGDAEGLHVAFSDPEVMRYWSTLPHAEMARTEKWVSDMQMTAGSGTTDFIICLKPAFTPIGKIGVYQGNEIGFMLARSYWGKGLAKEAMDLILSHLFSSEEFPRGRFDEVMADVDPRNLASLGLLKRVGFIEYDFREKTYQIGDDWQDSVYLKLDRESWSELVGKTREKA